mmetsp:Transcript_78469/g.163020  ORF Transcript_78469/g.163020 Transcript_78469/m.163020 type:complete len:92 (-) Transcript_78469:450-725(-)
MRVTAMLLHTIDNTHAVVMKVSSTTPGLWMLLFTRSHKITRFGSSTLSKAMSRMYVPITSIWIEFQYASAAMCELVTLKIGIRTRGIKDVM